MVNNVKFKYLPAGQNLSFFCRPDYNLFRIEILHWSTSTYFLNLLKLQNANFQKIQNQVIASPKPKVIFRIFWLYSTAMYSFFRIFFAEKTPDGISYLTVIKKSKVQ
jgi:hypothetical protein